MKRIQRQRTKGWSKPNNTTYVGRGSVYGNPFRVVQMSFSGKWAIKTDQDEANSKILTSTCRFEYDTKAEAAKDACVAYQKYVESKPHLKDLIETALHKKNLAC